MTTTAEPTQQPVQAPQAVPEVFHKTETAYALDRSGYTASGRLFFQHYLFKDVTGSVINPRILADLRASAGTVEGDIELKVADIGTGNSAWAQDVARGAGVAGFKFDVHGFDISDEQFPPSHILPSNLKLGIADALVTPPEELRGTFDIVHVAQFACVRPLHEDPGAAIDHALALLKPGGWLQWDEWARDTNNHVGMTKLSPAPRCEWALGVSSKVFPEWLIESNLANHLTKHGFTEATQFKFEPRDDQLPACTMLWFLTGDEIVRFGYEEPTKSLFLEALGGAFNETRDASIRAMFKTATSSVVGKKPASG
ncbi:hypothetical protein QBC34DRAFT_441631 [Podospora aff. communis PSN243]|uniref:Methyltransferase domain-containing protein n=1 Tax=Podospora aff. communis PSN243 TaxID=3040156 RepID=A0AAV9GEG6_9PEZI|nr:hypothetical protein QBC34DRAFT_441631 [Podospora aff. communis PSN243]